MAKKEYIDRKSLLQDINETVLFSCRVESITLESRGANKVINRIKAQPTADVQDVVYCKDCKFGEYDNEIKMILCKRIYNISEGESVYNNLNDFCSYGEKTEGNNG